ncbi:MAG TPA: hypothetical protein VFS92_11020, partial [Planctomycetota bacterium]|nr:hypothetical protein [Planctomycetota bacterium]
MGANHRDSPSRILALCALVLFSLPAAAAIFGDPALAKSLLEDGKKAVNSRKFDEAATLLRKALEEDPDLAEAAYWLGVGREKSKDDAGALAGYREFLAILDRKGGGNAEEKKLRAQAEKRIDVLAAGEKEFQKLEDRYVDELLAFATAKTGRDNGAASMALERILAVRQGYPAAISLREKIEGRSDAAASTDPDGPPLRHVKKWKDFIAERRLITSTISYSDGLMIVDVPGGSVATAADPIHPGKEFVCDMEFRVTKARGEWVAGITFGESGGNFLSAFASVSRVVLVEQAGSGQRSLQTALLPEIELNAWHRLVLAVRGPRVEAWFDGKKAFSHEFTDRGELKG